MNRLIEKIWQNRNYTEEWLNEIDTCPHALPSNIPEMCVELKKYHDSGEQIILLTDFDMDGIMTGVVGYAGLKELGFNVVMHMPDTGEYGIGTSEIDEAATEFPDAKCILMGDVGIGEYDSVAHAKELGFHILIIDHHEPQGEILPAADICIDPMCDKGDQYFGYICGAHVMYLLLHYYAEQYGGEQSSAVEQIERLRVFVGIGTVSDIMPLYYENRPMVRDAVKFCQWLYNKGDRANVDSIRGCWEYRNAFIGLFVVLQKFADLKKFSENSHEDFFSFYIAPAFNSIKRLHKDINLAYDVFFGGVEKAQRTMEEIIGFNEIRKSTVKKEKTKLLNGDDHQPWAPYIYLTNAIQGVRGLLAQNILEQTGEPVLVVSKIENGKYAGSGRAPEWFPFLKETFGIDHVHPAGHQGAFGVTIDDEQSCQELYDILTEKVQRLKPHDIEHKPDLVLSACSDNGETDIDLKLLKDFLYEIETYRPFGKGFEKPELELVFCPKDVQWDFMGNKDYNYHKHIKAVFPNGLQLICFNQAGYFPNVIDKAKMPNVTKVRGTLEFNDYDGKDEQIQFRGELGPDMDQSRPMS